MNGSFREARTAQFTDHLQENADVCVTFEDLSGSNFAANFTLTAVPTCRLGRLSLPWNGKMSISFRAE